MDLASDIQEVNAARKMVSFYDINKKKMLEYLIRKKKNNTYPKLTDRLK